MRKDKQWHTTKDAKNNINKYISLTEQWRLGNEGLSMDTNNTLQHLYMRFRRMPLNRFILNFFRI